MATYRTTLFPTSVQPRSMLKAAWAINKLTTSMVIVTATISIFTLIGIFADSRIVVGQPVWAKSTKFALSMAIYGTTLLWLFSFVNPRPRWVNWVLNITGVVLLLEMTILLIQGFRGQMMHFNYSTTIDSTLYAAMTVSIYLLFFTSIMAVVLIMRQKLPGRSFAWSLRLGLAVTVFAGYGVANLMVGPSETQLEGMVAGEEGAHDVIGAHTVGAEDGGPGLPLLGWSTTHGDLRPAHFFGLHALQVIPLLGLLVSRREEKWLSEGHRIALVIIGTLAYTGFVSLTAWQALRAEPIIAPSSTTLAALGGLIGTTIAAAALTTWHAKRNS